MTGETVRSDRGTRVANVVGWVEVVLVAASYTGAIWEARYAVSEGRVARETLSVVVRNVKVVLTNIAKSASGAQSTIGNNSGANGAVEIIQVKPIDTTFAPRSPPTINTSITDIDELILSKLSRVTPHTRLIRCHIVP